MPIDESFDDSWLTDLENDLGYDHFKSFNEIYYNQTENRSLNQKIKYFLFLKTQKKYLL